MDNKERLGVPKGFLNSKSATRILGRGTERCKPVLWVDVLKGSARESGGLAPTERKAVSTERGKLVPKQGDAEGQGRALRIRRYTMESRLVLKKSCHHNQYDQDNRID